MFNVTIIKIKDLIKYLLALIALIVVILGVKRYFFSYRIEELETNSLEKKILLPLNITVPVISKINEIEKGNNEIEEKDNDFSAKIYKYIIGTELGVIDTIVKSNGTEVNETAIADNEEEKNIENIIENEQTDKTNNSETIGDNTEKIEDTEKILNTEVVTKNPLKDSYTNIYNGVKIKNETDYELNDEMLSNNNINVNKTNIIIFHTHTCESYTSSEKYSYIPTGNFRTTDLNFSVAKVGDELEKNLNSYGLNVIHNKTFHDYPAYTGSYSRSLSTVSNILKNTKSDIIIDLHRDAIGSYSSYAPTVKIGEEECAQLMFVMGTNGGGLYHPNWQSNLKWAVSVQEKANKMYPGLFKTMIVRNSRYNQHLGKAACIIEVGATGNTLEQCLNSMKYLAKIIND